MTRLLQSIVALSVLTASAAASATPTTKDVTPADLADGKITVKPVKNGLWTIVIDPKEKKHCTRTAAGGTLTIDKKADPTDPCQQIFSLAEPALDGFGPGTNIAGSPDITLHFIDTKPATASGSWSGPSVLDIKNPDDPTVYFVDGDNGWTKGSVAQATKALGAVGNHSDATLYFLAGGSEWHKLTVKGVPAQEAPTCDVTTLNAIADQFCKDYVNANPDYFVGCYRYDGSWRPIQTLPGILPQNSKISVLAVVAPGESAKFELEGEPAIAAPETRNATGIATAGTTDCQKLLVRVPHPFSSRSTGSHKLTLTHMKGKDVDDANPYVAELIWEKAYAGAIRLGVGAIFGGARDRAYEARTLPGSGQAEIVATQGGVMDAELVLGAAAFFDKGGRLYVSREPDHWAPYLGIGILNQSATGLELLKSIHLGVEYEISQDFSIAFTIVGRKVTRLADGLVVGGPITDMTVPTRTGYEIGFGVVMNVSPDFFKIAKKSGSSFFSGGS